MISVIITNYNNGGLLIEAVASVLRQSYDDLEVIVVDDCSTDDSIEKLKDEFNSDKRLKIFELSENHGAGYARDYGLKRSNGEWISFIDGDDWIYPDFYKELIEAAERYNADIISCKIDNEGLYRGIDFRIIEDKQEMINSYLIATNYYLNNKIVKKELFFPEGYCRRRYIEDTPTFIRCMMRCRRECFIPYIGYFYRKRENSLTHKASNTKNMIYESLAEFEIYETIHNAGYRCYINPVELAIDLVLKGEYGLLDGKEIEEKYAEDFALLNRYVDKYYPKEMEDKKINKQ